MRAIRRVRHAKFGEGSVVSADGGKLTIDFAKVGTKVLIARFVSDA